MAKTAKVTSSTQDLADDLQRNAQLRKTRAELMKVLFNRRGLERLRGISDEDWREAEARDINSD